MMQRTKADNNVAFNMGGKEEAVETVASIPCCRRNWMPLPFTRGLGSSEPVTTRLMREANMAFTQGGCFLE